MKCLLCRNIELRNHPKHAKVGFGQCKAKLVSGCFVSLNRDRDCSDYKRADESVIIKRMAWSEGLRK